MAEVTEKQVKIFPVGATPTLIVRHNAGTMRIIGAAIDHIAVEANKVARATNEVTAQRAISTLEVVMTQTGDAVRIETKYHHLPDMVFMGDRHIDLVITVPTALALNINLNAGSAEIDATRGVVELEMNAGRTTLRDVVFAGVSHVRINAGTIQGTAALAAATSLEIAVNTGNLDLALPANTAAHLEATINAGKLTLDGWNIPVHQHFVQATASGDFAPQPTSNIVVRANAGRIAFTQR